MQQAITLGLLLLAIAAMTVLWQAQHPVWALCAGLVMLLGHAVFLGIEFVLLAWVAGREPGPSAGLVAMLRAWLGEVAHSAQAFCWRQPFRSNALPDVLPTEAGAGRRGIVLVHGLLCNRGFWNPWLTKLRAAGVPVVAVNLEPVFCSIDEHIHSIERAVSRIERATGQTPLLVGHSMGGLVLRAWLAAHGSAERVHHVITIGTPHRGTWMARFSHTTCGREMRLGSDWLAGLRRGEAGTPSARFTCFFSRCDNIVFPASTATLPCADNREVPAVAHVQMAFHNEVFREALRRLAEPAPDQ